MIKPSEVKPPGSKPELYDQHMIALERMCDASIRDADKSQIWPAPVGVAVFSLRVVKDTMQKYRDAGWSVDLVSGKFLGGTEIRIDRPTRHSAGMVVDAGLPTEFGGEESTVG